MRDPFRRPTLSITAAAGIALLATACAHHQAADSGGVSVSAEPPRESEVTAPDPAPRESDDATGYLSRAELRRCAQRVRTLRQRSVELLQRAHALNKRRQALNAQYRRLQAGTHGQADGGVAQAWIRYNAKASDFNEDMARLRRELRQLNEVKRAYGRHCANRPYRPSDLRALPKALQHAMKAGLKGVRVPYVRK